MAEICDLEELESTVGDRPLGVMMKSIPSIDDHCRAVLDRAAAAVLVYRSAGGQLGACVVGGGPTFASIVSPTRLTMAAPADADDDSPAATVFLVPGWRETLRINGHLSNGELAVSEAFLHCGKAIIRSSFWSAPGGTTTDGPTGSTDHVDETHRAFLATAPFAVLGSCDIAGGADASPKGDPAGFIRVVDERTIAVPDRPGNRRTDTFHNVVDAPDVVLAAMTPGDDRVLEVRGRARLTTEPEVLAPMAVNGRAPKIALLIDVTRSSLASSDAIRSSGLWDPANHVDKDDLPRATRIWTDHVKQNETEGLAAKALRAGTNEAALRAGIALDYRQNLY